jgi:hypothetical protein
MLKVVLIITLGLAVAVAVPMVFAQNPPAAPGHTPEPGAAPSHGGMPAHEGAAAGAPHGGMPAHGGADVHARHMQMMGGMLGSGATMPGQDAFGAIAEIVRVLDADPSTDWTKVDLERLRQHLIDMHEVVLRAAVKQVPIAGGLAMEITGTGRTEQAIRSMVVAHTAELDRMPSLSAKSEPIAAGVRLTVIARKPDDQNVVARIRGLGFAGLLTEGAHHQAHHLAMAKGEAIADHAH